MTNFKILTNLKANLELAYGCTNLSKQAFYLKKTCQFNPFSAYYLYWALFSAGEYIMPYQNRKSD